jgi:hypothetical protein
MTPLKRRVACCVGALRSPIGSAARTPRRSLGPKGSPGWAAGGVVISGQVMRRTRQLGALGLPVGLVMGWVLATPLGCQGAPGQVRAFGAAGDTHDTSSGRGGLGGLGGMVVGVGSAAVARPTGFAIGSTLRAGSWEVRHPSLQALSVTCVKTMCVTGTF